VPGIVVLLVKLPKPRATDAEVLADRSLVPKDTVLDAVRLGGVVQNQTLVILSATVHHRGEAIIGGKNSEKTFV
jgi:hypothetical protein